MVWFWGGGGVGGCSELVAQSVWASLPGVCPVSYWTIRHRFETILFIITGYLVLHQYALSPSHRPLNHIETARRSEKACHLFRWKKRRNLVILWPGLVSHSWRDFWRRRTCKGLDAMPTSAIISRNSSSPASHSCWTSSPPEQSKRGVREASRGEGQLIEIVLGGWVGS